MTLLDTSKAAGYASQADKAAVRALGFVEQALDVLRRTTSVRTQVEGLLDQLHISFRWVGTRLDLMGPDGAWVIGPDLKGEHGTEVDDIGDVPGLTAALAAKQSGSAALAALAQVTPAVDKLPFFGGENVGQVTNFTEFARSIVAAATATDVRTVLQLALVASSGAYADLTGKPVLGTAAPLNTGVAAGQIPLLGAGGKLAEAVLPSVAITDTFVVASQAAMLALTAERGDIAVRSDENKTYALSTNSPSTLADWILLRTPTDLVLSVAGRTGAVALTTADVSGLGAAASRAVGTATTNLVEVLAGAKLPALSASNLTDIPVSSSPKTARAANFSFVAGDLGGFSVFTAVVTATLPAAGLAAGWVTDLRSEATTVCTLTAATGTIDGQTSILVYPKETFRIHFDGTNFRTIARSRGLIACYATALPGVSSIDIESPFLDPEFTKIRIDVEGFTWSGAGQRPRVQLKKSGAYQAGATYVYALYEGTSSGANGIANVSVNDIQLSTTIINAGELFCGEIEVRNFNSAVGGGAQVTHKWNINNRYVGGGGGSESTAAVVRGLRLTAAGSTFTAGSIRVFGERGPL